LSCVPFLFLLPRMRVLPPVHGKRRRARAATNLRGRVVCRKGELSKRMMDRNWPQQVALPHIGASATTIAASNLLQRAVALPADALIPPRRRRHDVFLFWRARTRPAVP